MASRLRVNTSTLNQTRQNVQDRLNQIQKNMEQISADLNTLNSMWTGDAHENFQANVNADLEFLQTICKGIQNVITYESNAVKEYNKCEQQVNEIISQIKI